MKKRIITGGDSIPLDGRRSPLSPLGGLAAPFALLTVLLSVVVTGCGGTTTKTVVQTVTAKPQTTPPAATGTTESLPQTETTAPAVPELDPATATCTELHMTRATGAKEGTCHDPDGSRNIVTNKAHTVKLKTITAHLNGIRVVDSVSSGSGGISAIANGKFVILSVTVENRTESPQAFQDVGDSTATLAIDSGIYTQDFEASNQADQASFLSQDDSIQPGGTKTGDLIFDIPAKRVKRVFTQGVLSLINLGADPETTRTYGLIRLYK